VRISQNNITTLCEQNKVLNVMADDTHNYHWILMIKSKGSGSMAVETKIHLK
jgi:hypothetical protein